MKSLSKIECANLHNISIKKTTTVFAIVAFKILYFKIIILFCTFWFPQKRVPKF